ncbi:hypothetical protein HDG41_007142 [Paraburkholderia sp. JPY162]|uniref:Uncharacterized protein n=1 Tax=Paraburkholderia youngii TaxID=2782701 RepID=A0A7W8P655_9BURK|nr:hypothetical protein [Paraburkholderia youngii]
MTAVIQVFEQFALRVLMRPLGRREYSFVEPMKKLFVGRGLTLGEIVRPGEAGTVRC